MEGSFKGLTSVEVQSQKSLGLSNEVIDSYTSSYLSIYLRNIFSLINIIIIPLLVVLASFQLYTEILAFGMFLFINTIVSILDEVRIKKKLDKLKSEFQISANVIRDGKEQIIPISEIVQGDYVKAKDGDGIIADGKILYERYLQIDESILTGESNYLRKETGEKVLSGSYVVTGECVYVVESVGKNNYLNKLGSEAVKVKEQKSPIQKAANKIILFLIIASLLSGVLNLYMSIKGGYSYEESILSLTTIIALIIPQTLIFLYTLTYTISITKLYSKGILIQKGGSIEELSEVNVICFDKTGTITDNKMKIKDVKYFNLEQQVFGSFYNSAANELVGVNETQRNINEYFQDHKKLKIGNLDQIPFTSKQKYSLFTAEVNGENNVVLLGAFSAISDVIDKSVRSKVESYLNEQESKGFRVLTALLYQGKFNIEDPLNFSTDKVAVFTIEETLNPGIKDILDDLKSQSINVRIISGDSKISVTRICQKIGIPSDQVVDLSEVNLEDDLDMLVRTKTVFTRAKPEDKLKIINALNFAGFKTAMVGDGINDVLALKSANVSIAMETGAKVAREVSDIVLLKNDYKKIPEIFFEGDNIIYNLKLSTKIFLVKSLFALLISLYFSLSKEIIPLHPSSTLIFSFLGSSAPSYVLIFTRQKIEEVGSFFKDILRTVIPTSIVFSILFLALFETLAGKGIDSITINTALVIFVLAISIIYSLYLVWESKKIKNLLLAGFVFILLTTIGLFQTILPIELTDPVEVNILLLGIIFITSIVVGILLFRRLKPKSLSKRLLLGFISIVWVPIVLLFPFRSYYSVVRVSIENYYYVGIFALTGLVLIVLVNYIVKRIIKI